MLFCHVLSEYVRICQNGSFLSCIYLHLPQIFAFDLPEKLSESLAPGSRLSEGVIFKGCVVSGIPPDIAYDISRCLCYFIASHIVSLYFVYLIVSFHDVEECILFDFKFFFWQVEVKELGGTSLCSTRPRVHSSCNRCYWSQGAGQNGQIQKIQKKDEKGLLLFVHVCCNVEDWYKLYKLFESRNSGIGEKFRQRNYSNSYAGPRR